MREARQTYRTPVRAGEAAAAAPHTGWWIATFFLLSSLLIYMEIRSEVARLESRAHLGAASAVGGGLSYAERLDAAASIRPDVD